MKRLAAIILSTIILFSFAACDISSGTDKEIDSTPSTTDEEIDQPAHANPEHFANFSSYDEIIRTYKAIVKCFDHYTVEEYRNNEYKSLVDFPSEEIEETYKKLFFSAFYHYKDDYATAYLDEQRQEALRVMREIMDAIKSVPDDVEQTVLIEHYINGRTLNEIQKDICYEKRNTIIIHGRALWHVWQYMKEKGVCE